MCTKDAQWYGARNIIVVMCEWEDLGYAAYQSHVKQKVMKFDLHHVE